VALRSSARPARRAHAGRHRAPPDIGETTVMGHRCRHTHDRRRVPRERGLTCKSAFRTGGGPPGTQRRLTPTTTIVGSSDPTLVSGVGRATATSAAPATQGSASACPVPAPPGSTAARSRSASSSMTRRT
jgi:hypothetical protein